MNTRTLEQMQQLRLHGMHRAFSSSLLAQSITYTNDELIAYLLQSEWDDRQNRKIDRLTKAAKFRYKALIEDVDYEQSRNIEKNQIQRFARLHIYDNLLSKVQCYFFWRLRVLF